MLPGVPIHCIAGNFGDKADVILDPSWCRFRLPGADGWDKWDGGKWFARLFYEDLPPRSEESNELAREIWRQGLALAELLAAYIEEREVGLLFPVNTNSNPGNVAFALAIVLAAEATGFCVLNNNHDFFWEGGKAGRKRKPGEVPGPRDHFFRNHNNEEFFSVFQRLFPWNGHRWVQVNINPLQVRRLIDRYHFRPDRVFTIGTGLDPEFFRVCTSERKRECRRRMAHVLGGAAVIETTPVALFRTGLEAWMADQRPVVCGAEGGWPLDITTGDALYLLQPTRVVGRKRIWRDWELIGALLRYAPFREAFEQRPELTLTLHVTGPVPIEHQRDLERVLAHYRAVLDEVPEAIGRRLFQAFSVGWQSHQSLVEGLEIVDIYHLADLVVFPSLTEGRGLPIPESAAAGVPIVCSHYEPRAVFAEVVGMHLPSDQRIHHEEFPEAGFPDELLARLTAILLDPAGQIDRVEHNREAARRRYSLAALQSSFTEVLDRLARTVRS